VPTLPVVATGCRLTETQLVGPTTAEGHSLLAGPPQAIFMLEFGRIPGGI
jgi:hypothetical protein